MKKILMITGGIFSIIGITMLFSSFTNITGFAVLENLPIFNTRILGLAFLLIGIISMVFGREKTEKESELEKKVGYGKNVELHTIFVRHGDRDEEGNLTYKGRRQAIAYGKRLEKKTAIKGYSSEIPRSLETTERIIESAPHNKKLKTRIRKEIGLPNFSKRFFDVYNERYVKDPDSAGDWYLNLKKRFDKTTPTAKELAEGFAYIIQKSVRMADKLYSGSKVDLIEGTHQNLPECLLKEVMIRNVNGKRVRGFDSVKEIGGLTDYTEPVDFVIKKDDEGKSYVNLHFRGKEYDVDMRRLNQLANAYVKRVKGRK